MECTLNAEKINETKRKLKLINYKDMFLPGQNIPVFITLKADENDLNVYGEINPNFKAVLEKWMLKKMVIVV